MRKNWIEGKSVESAAGWPEFGFMAYRNRFKDLQALLRTSSPTLVDAGAASGAMIKKFLQMAPTPVIHAFEPIPQRVAQLKERFGENANVTIHDVALGAENKEINFYVTNNLVSSSVLMPGSICDNYHHKNTAVERTITVKQVRIDEVLDTEIDIFKLDLQGYELEALKGAEKLLTRTKVILSEVEFVPLYENQPLFGDLDIYLRSKGFRFFNFYDLYTQADGQLTAGDAIWVNLGVYGDHGGA